MATLEASKAISGTQDYLTEGDRYLKVVVNAHKRPEIFDGEMRFSLLTMAIEKHVMALLMSTGTLPPNHTFVDLLDGLKWVVPVSEEVDAQLRQLDRHESMCGLGVSNRPIPSASGTVQRAASEMVAANGEPSFALE